MSGRGSYEIERELGDPNTELSFRNVLHPQDLNDVQIKLMQELQIYSGLGIMDCFRVMEKCNFNLELAKKDYNKYTNRRIR